MVDLLPGLLVVEAHAVVSLHDPIPRPLAHRPAQVGLLALAHGALCTVGLHAYKKHPWSLLCAAALVLVSDRPLPVTHSFSSPILFLLHHAYSKDTGREDAGHSC